jgi:hypothetical protein
MTTTSRHGRASLMVAITHIRGNAQLDRILKHSTCCKYLQESNRSLWQDALCVSRDGSLGARVEEGVEGGDEMQITSNTRADDEPPAKKMKNQSCLDLGMYRALGKKEKEDQRKLFQARVDHLIMGLFALGA